MHFPVIPTIRSFMPIDALGKMLFPDLQRWERRRRMKFILRVLMAAVVLGGTVGIMMYVQAMYRR